MAGRFAASKFKNTHPKTPKREDCVTELPIGGLSCANNGIQAGRTFLAFHVDGEGGKLGVLAQDAKGRKTRDDLGILCAHSEAVADFGFLPFQNDSLLTVARGEEVKLWSVGSEDEKAVIAPLLSLNVGEMGAEAVACHPTAAGLAAVGRTGGAVLLDLDKGTVKAELASGDDERAACLSWSGDGKEMVLQDRSSRLSMFDPRSGSASVATCDNVHQGKGRESRVLFLGNEGKLITSGFSKMRARELYLYDRRKFESPMHVQPFEPSTGLLIPLFDADTKLLYLAGKGSNRLTLCELLNKPPYFGDVGSNSPTEQTLGACILPKWSLDVMNGEVGRCIQLTRSTLYPISCVVPRKTYRDFIPELFPPTVSLTPGAPSADAWLGGDDTLTPRYSLDPAAAAQVDKVPFSAATKPSVPISANTTVSSILDNKPAPIAAKETVSSFIEKKAPPPLSPKPVITDNGSNGVHETPKETATNGVPKSVNGFNGHHTETPKTVTFRTNGETNGKDTPSESAGKENGKPSKIDVFESYAERPKSEFQPLPAPKVTLRSSMAARPSPAPEKRNTIATPTASLFGARRTKFKHTSVKLETTKAKVFYNLRKVNSALPLECGGFTVSSQWAAVPMAGGAGLIAIFDLANPVKMADGVIPGLENGAGLGDLAWDPFDGSRLAVGLDNGNANIWRIPDEGVEELLQEPEVTWNAAASKIVAVAWNPVASNVIATAAMDGEVVIWSLEGREPVAKARFIHPKAVLCLAWAANGDRLATAAKDGRVRVFSPLSGSEPVATAACLDSVKAARLLWACDDELLLLSGFSKSSQREVSLLCSSSLELKTKKPFDQSSVLLIPYFDFDTNIVFMTGKGDVTVHMFEVINEAPWFLDIPAFKDKVPHQGLSFHFKRECEVGRVEFAKGWRLTLNEIQPLSFTVPRRHTHKYQNDIFPPAIARWSPAASASQWFAGQCNGAATEDLCPAGMDLLYPDVAVSNPVVTTPKPRLPEPEPAPVQPKEATKEDLMSAISARMDVSGTEKRSLEQDGMEGVAEEEWAH